MKCVRNNHESEISRLENELEGAKAVNERLTPQL